MLPNMKKNQDKFYIISLGHKMVTVVLRLQLWHMILEKKK